MCIRDSIGSGVAVSALLAPTLGAIAMKVGDLIMLATNLSLIHI